jgi:hypothetical protein
MPEPSNQVLDVGGSPFFALTPAAAAAPAEQPASRGQVERALTEGNPAAGYKPALPIHGWTWGDNGLPPLWQYYSDLPAMLPHPVIENGLDYYKSGVTGAEIESIEASSPAVARFADKEFRNFWGRCLPTVQLGYDYGWCGCMARYTVERGLLSLDTLDDFAPRDTTPLVGESGDYCGFRLRNVPDGHSDLWGPSAKSPAKGFWYAHRARYGLLHGRSQAFPSWQPWRRLAARDGADETIDHGFYRFAFRGPVTRYPEGNQPPATIKRPGPERQSNQECARQMGEGVKHGAAVTMPSTRDANGEFLWGFEWPDHVLDVQVLLAYPLHLHDLMTLGCGTPPELIKASETGSGYSGREIPLEGFFCKQQVVANSILRQWMEQILLPLVRWNFGPRAWCKITLASLLKTRVRDARANAPDGQGVTPNAGNGRDPNDPNAQPNGNADGFPKPNQFSQFGQMHKPLMLATGNIWRPVMLATAGPGNEPIRAPGAGALLGDTWYAGGAEIRRDDWEAASEKDRLAVLKRMRLGETKRVVLGTEEPKTETSRSQIETPAEAIAREAAAALSKLSEAARHELLDVLAGEGTEGERLDRAREVLARYRVTFGRQLGYARLAALLDGMREAAKDVPPLAVATESPALALDPTIAAAVEFLRPMPEGLRQDALKVLMPEARAAVEQAIAAGSGSAGPPWRPTAAADEGAGGDTPPPLLKLIDEAVSDLRRRVPFTREDFDQLDARSRDEAFTVAGIEEENAIAKVQDALAEAAAEGPTLKAFKKKVEETVGEGTFLSDSHAENVYRTNLQTAYSNGQDTVLAHPMVADLFPYRAIYPIRDDRVRPWHLALEKAGIDGTNVYNASDPTWSVIRPPSDFSCRCGWAGMSIEQAAAAGVREAQRWLDTGNPPATPAHVPLPAGWRQSPSFVRMAVEPSKPVRLATEPPRAGPESSRQQPITVNVTPHVTINVPEQKPPVVENKIENHVDVPPALITVEPTPVNVNVNNKVEPTPVNVTVEPTPVNIENKVETPVVEAHIHPPAEAEPKTVEFEVKNSDGTTTRVKRIEKG